MPLKTTELRIGNLITTKEGAILTVYGVTGYRHEHGNIIWYDRELGFYIDETEAMPIQLNVKILKLNGFTLLDDNDRSCRIKAGGHLIDFVKNENGDFVGNVKYVHQLQNLCFALTGDELKLDK